VQTGLRPAELLVAAHRIEAEFGRIRAERFGPRTLDIDIISYESYEDEVSSDPVLTLPHPRAHERAFVLVPWHDIDARAELPGRGAVDHLLAGLDRNGIRQLPDAILRRPRSGSAAETA
jgi:2-amino-4-hydroxy-6-hydroxymethyldihydropteridine diphosphokinase